MIMKINSFELKKKLKKLFFQCNPRIIKYIPWSVLIKQGKLIKLVKLRPNPYYKNKLCKQKN